MKRKLLNIIAIGTALSFTFLSCNDMLDEKPKSVLTPQFFQTAQGLETGVVAGYSGLRFHYGPGGGLENTVIGTDEFTSTDAMNGTEGSMNTYDNQLNPINEQITNGWNHNFTFINTCNGVIQYGVNADDMDADKRKQMLAEARFLRAHYYFLLVQTYGGVPLNLGAGDLAFNTTPSTRSVRSSASDVYKSIINDLRIAVNDLPDRPGKPGRAAKGAALHFLAKTYLTRASHDDAKLATDYDSAFYYAEELINNKATYGVELTRDYDLVHQDGHENDPEVIFSVQRTSDYDFGESNVNAPESGFKENRGNFFFTAGYENVKINGVAVVPRCMEYQRPWRMFVPTEWLIFNVFADKKNDSRWDNSFRMMWKCRASKENGSTDSDLTKLAAYGMQYGDTAIVLLLTNTIPPEYQNKKYTVYTPNQFYLNSSAQYMYPNLTKFDDPTRDNINYASDRTFIVARFAETYLISAEAAYMKGDLNTAKSRIETIRKRAAYRSNLSPSQLLAAEQAMEISTSNINIDFILDERTREMCGEQWRWFDLTRTKKLVQRVRLYNEKASNNVQEYHMLRPIPQTQINLMTDPNEKAGYQNPGYN